MKRIVKFWRLPATERRLLVSALAYLAAFRTGLWVLPLQSLLRRGQTLKVSETLRVYGVWEPQRIAWALRVAGRYLPGGRNCLVQALAGQALLARCGCPAQLRVGVATGAGFKAHAWLEHEGRILIGGAEAARYTALPPLERRCP